MEAIKKKMQMLKVDKEDALDRCEVNYSSLLDKPYNVYYSLLNKPRRPLRKKLPRQKKSSNLFRKNKKPPKTNWSPPKNV